MSHAENAEVTRSIAVALETVASNQLISRSLESAGEAAYHWNIGTDSLTWSGNAGSVLQRQIEDFDTGRKYAGLLDSDSLTSRFDVVMNSAAKPDPAGVPFRVEYQLRPEGNAPAIWIEDSGCWFPDSEGRPKDVFGVVHHISDRHEKDQQLSFLSRNDALTGMMNRGRMTEVLDEAISVAVAGGAQCAFAIASIKNLNVINEAYGFDVADEVISAVAKRLRQVMRSGDGIARYSGSKFGIILNSCTPLELARALDRFLLVVRDSVIETKHGPVWALLSIGAVPIPENANDSSAAMSKAEEALNTALQQLSDNYVVYAPSAELATERMLNARCATEIIDCLKNGIFHLAFQPVIEAKSGQAVIHEALLRMKDTAGEFVAAGHLVPVAERLGLIRLIDRAVLQLALETLHRYPEARLSINISATTANDARWNSQLVDMIASAEPMNERLIVEITETTALADLKVALSFFEKLRAAGCCVAIDDFGAGFTSFRNLRDLPVDIIKLDGSYCRNLATDPENNYFAKTLIDLAHRFGIKTVAEWVETAEDAETLTALGIDYLQGNHFGVPQVIAPWKTQDSSTFTFAEGEELPHLKAIATDAIETQLTRGADVAADRTVSNTAAVAIEPAEEIVFETVTANDQAAASRAPAAAYAAETPLHQAAFASVVQAPASDDVSHAVDGETSDAVYDAPASADEFEVHSETADSLQKLRAALAELNRHFQPHEAGPKDLKLAG